MLTAKDLQYRPIAPGQEYNFLPLQGRLIDTVPALKGLECQLHAGEVSSRRPANFLDLGLMRIDAVNLDPAKLEGGEKAREAFIRAAWGNHFNPSDMNLVSGNEAVLMYDMLEALLSDGVENISEVWQYQDGVLYPAPIVDVSNLPKFRIDDSFNRPLSPVEAKEHRWWRAALRNKQDVHHAYVDALHKAVETIGVDSDNIMGVYTTSVSKPTLRPWILYGVGDGDRSDAGGGRRLDGAGARLVGVRREVASGASNENVPFSGSPSQGSASGAEGEASAPK